MTTRTVKLYLDDVRPLPDDTWTLARTVEEAQAILTDKNVTVIELSLDHDLGQDERGNDLLSGYDLAYWLCENHIFPPVVHVHSDNSVGIGKMPQMLVRYGGYHRLGMTLTDPNPADY